MDQFASLTSSRVCVFVSLCGPGEKCSVDSHLPLAVEGLIPPETRKLAPIRQCLRQTPGRWKDAPYDCRPGPLQTPPTEGGPRCAACGRGQGKEMEDSLGSASCQQFVN